MSNLRILVCDDEPLALRRLSGLLSRVPDCEVVGAFEDPQRLMATLDETRPDLLLLDVDMPEMDGFDVIETISRREGEFREAPLFAFVTGSDRHAPAAFDNEALDFLLKPVRLGRLEDTVGRARRALSARDAERRLASLETASGHPGQARVGEGHVWVTRRGETIRIDLDLVDRIAAEGAYVRLHLGERSFLHRESMGGIERRVEPGAFLRVHRSHLVRIADVTSLRRTAHGGSEVALRDGFRAPVGRTYAKLVRQRVLSESSIALVATDNTSCAIE